MDWCKGKELLEKAEATMSKGIEPYLEETFLFTLLFGIRRFNGDVVYSPLWHEAYTPHCIPGASSS